MATTQLRFTSEKQKKSIKKIAKQNGRSMNGEIVIAIDKHISSYNVFPITPEKLIAQKQSNKK